MSNVISWRRSRLPLAIGLANSLVLPAQAIDFSIGEIEGQFDSSLSIGASWSVRDADPHLIGENNGGKGFASGTDDGRLNFRKGETFSKIFKGTHDLELKYADSGLFVRGKYWYDFELKDESRPFVDIDDHNRKQAARSSGAELLDAFIYHNYVIGELPGTVRLGKQVVSWGESTFIQGGINSINPVDVSAFRRPGAEIKEGLIPVNMFYLSQNLTDNLSAEAFYQLDWQQTVVDNCGTFFSQNDFIADGCDVLTVGPNLSDNPFAQAALTPFGVILDPQGIQVPRLGDADARDGGQWGLALRWFVPSIDAEFGAYALNYHSRQPYVNSMSSLNIADSNFIPQLCANLGIPDPALCAGLLGPALNDLGAAYRLGTSRYQVAYPEDIRLYGLSFATTLPTGTALSGEISYRPNMPMQLNAVDQVLAGTGDPAVSPLLSSGAYTATNSTLMEGYRRKPMTQVQFSAVHFFDQVMGADRLTLVGEVGLVHVGDLEGKGGLRYGRDPVFGQGALYPDNQLCRTVTSANTAQNCNDHGFLTSTSWGYRARAIWEYSNLIPAMTFRPNLAWSHDVEGYAPEPGFNEGSKAISLGLDVEYRNTYYASLSYTDFFGGRYNTNIDRDFVALSFGMPF
ncbi:type V secretory pathway, adhesin AidA [Ectopseudomonas oleovorans]|nr:type V secretory pathway, adhesin AidA [Pseudomonas oleovorans]